MRDIMYEIPSRDDVEKCIVSKASIEDENVRPALVLKTKTENSEQLKEESA